jgi:hypothetical protein
MGGFMNLPSGHDVTHNKLISDLESLSEKLATRLNDPSIRALARGAKEWPIYQLRGAIEETEAYLELLENGGFVVGVVPYFPPTVWWWSPVWAAAWGPVGVAVVGGMAPVAAVTPVVPVALPAIATVGVMMPPTFDPEYEYWKDDVEYAGPGYADRLAEMEDSRLENQ